MSSDWRRVRLGDVADILCGYAFPTAKMNYDGDGPRVLSGANIGFGELSWSPDRRWTRMPDDGLDRFELAAGDVVVGMNRPVVGGGLKYAKVRAEDLPALLFQRVARIRGTSMLTARFARFTTASPRFREHVTRVATGSTLPVILERHIREFEFDLPSLPEQERIASVLGALDDKLDSNRRLAGSLEGTAATLFRARFVDFVGVEEFEESEIGRTPRGWGVGSVYEFAEVTYGRPFKSSLFNDTEGTPLIRIRDLASNEPSVLTPEVRPDARLIRRGDIVVGMDGEFRAYAWAGPDSWLNQRVCAFDARNEISRTFLLEAIKRPLAFFESTKGGTTVIHLGKRDIDTFVMAVPPSDVMREFGAVADPLLKLAVELRWESRIVASLRDQLLPKLVAGEIRVPDTADPAEMIEPAADALASAS